MTLLLLFGSSAVALLFLWFVHLERSGQEIVTIGTILTVLVVDAALYPGFDVPTGVFHPQLGTTSFRPYEVIIVVALAARLAAKGVPRRVAAWSLCWVAFFVWVALQGLVGLYMGHSAELVAFEAKVVVYLGAMALVAGVPAEHLLRSRTMTRVIGFAAAVAVGMILLDTSGLRVTKGIPGVPLQEFGRMGSDFASICLAIGIVALGLSLARRRGRTGLLVAGVALILSITVPTQRAVLISFLALVVVGALAFASRSALQRVRVSSAELVVAAMVVGALVCIPWMLGAWGGTGSQTRITSRVSTAFTSPAKLQSAQDRILQYQEVQPLIMQKPAFGWGLGKTYAHFAPGPNEFIVNNLTHNIFADLLLRTGVVGLVLFSTAVGVSLLEGFRAWRAHPNDEVACLALACVIVIVGLLGKGSVESIFEKFRLAVLLGVFLGMLRSLALASVAPRPAALDDRVAAR